MVGLRCFWGAPDFQSRGPKILILKGLGTSGRNIGAPQKITLPAFKEDIVNIFFVFAWEFCIEKWRGFLVNFFWSPSPTKRSTKSPQKTRGKFGAKFGSKFGMKIRETFILQLS